MALPPASELALLNDNPKLDCTGLKIDNLRKRICLHSCVWAHFKVEEPCNTVTERHFDYYCWNFFNRCKKSLNRQNLDFFTQI